MRLENINFNFEKLRLSQHFSEHRDAAGAYCFVYSPPSILLLQKHLINSETGQVKGKEHFY